MNWYLDANILVPLHIEEPRSAAVFDLINETDAELVVSTLASSEFISAISRRVRMGLFDASEADFWIAQFEGWAASDVVHLAVEDEDIRRAGGIVRRYETRLLTPDAIHLALCERHSLTMITLDRRLADAAGMLGVKVLMPA